MGDGDLTLLGLFSAGAGAAGPEGSLLGPGPEPATYTGLEEEASRVAAVLTGAGVRPGDRIAAVVDKSPAVLALYLAALRVGGVYLPLNPAYTDEELAYVMADAEPRVVVVTSGRHRTGSVAAPPGAAVFTCDRDRGGTLLQAAGAAGPGSGEADEADVVADDPAVLLYTSGTTGRPKGALLTHGNLASNAATLRDAWGFRPADRLLHALPVYHAHGLLVGVNVTLATGSSLHWLDRFDPAEVAGALPAATVFMGVPTYYRRLLDEPGVDAEHCAGVRLFISGSAPLPPTLHAAWERRTGKRILERYGMTETVMITSNPLDARDGERRPGSVGRALAGVEVRVVDPDCGGPRPTGEVGEVQVRGPNVFAGYWRRPEQTAAAFTADGWFRTGDLGTLDAGGYLTLVGRSKDLVITGGLNVYPKEVEDVLDALSSVSESAVVGLPDDDLGERVAAAVVAAGAGRLDAEALRDHARRRLAGYKVPKTITQLDELPRNAMGKVDKVRVRHLLERAGTDTPVSS